MSTTTREREDFIATMQREYPDDAGVAAICRRIMRQGTTSLRLAEALCNGDWPCDNGERKLKECPECGTGYAPSSFRKGVCPDCRCEAIIREICLELGLRSEKGPTEPDFSGDPRGYTVKLKLPSGRTEVGVPTS